MSKILSGQNISEKKSKKLTEEEMQKPDDLCEEHGDKKQAKQKASEQDMTNNILVDSFSFFSSLFSLWSDEKVLKKLLLDHFSILFHQTKEKKSPMLLVSMH